MSKSAYSFLINHKDDEPILGYVYHCLVTKKELTVEDLSLNCYVSKSGITRFFQAHGYDGFKEFKYLLMNENLNKVENDALFEADFDYEVMIDPIRSTSKLNPVENFKQAYDYLKTASMNYILGAGGNDSVALELNIRLERLGFRTSRSNDFHNMYILLSNIQPNDVVWVFSYSGETREIIRLTKWAKDHGAIVVAISRDGQSSLTKLADLVFKIDSTENLIRIFSLKSRTAMNYIVNKLVWYIYSQDPVAYNEKMTSNLY